MTDKEKLNSILRLRLLFSTEDELADMVGYTLRGNHFNRFDGFRAAAYYCKIAQECRECTSGRMNLDTLLEQYEATSIFYKRYIEHTVQAQSMSFLPLLLERIFLGITREEGARTKDVLLCERYVAENERNGLLNIGILMLLGYGLIPTFKNKAAQDVKDIIGDFQRAYDILHEIAMRYQPGATIMCRELLCLKEMRILIEEEKAGDRYINRLLLIFFTNDTLGRIFSLLAPAKQLEYVKEQQALDLRLARFWRDEREAENVVWEFEPLYLDGVCYLYRRCIDVTGKKVHFTRYQLKFIDTGHKELSYTLIMRSAWGYHNILKRQQPDDAITSDCTELEYDKRDCREVTSMTFTVESPIGEVPLTLKPVCRQSSLDYYEAAVDHKGFGKGFADVDDFPEYAMDIFQVEVAVSDLCILFLLGDTVYKLYKFYEDGTETIPGVGALTHKENFVIAKVTDNGKERSFLCLDSINQNLDLDELMQQPYFCQIEEIADVF